MARDDPATGLPPTFPQKPSSFDDSVQNETIPSMIDNSSMIIDSKSNQTIFKILSSLGDKRSGYKSSLGGRIRDLFVSLASVGGIDERSSNPHSSLFRAIDRIDEKKLRKNTSIEWILLDRRCFSSVIKAAQRRLAGYKDPPGRGLRSEARMIDFRTFFSCVRLA